MKYALQTLRPALARTTGLALVMALAVSFVGLTHADTFYQLTVNVTDSCGPVVAQVTVVNGPDDGAFGITNSTGQFVFNNLHAGVFYLHITAANHASKDTDTIVLNSNQTVNVGLALTGSCNPPGGSTLALTVNVTDSCGPVVAQVTVVNGPDDGAFGITNNNGQFVFNNLHAGVFYLHITAADHTSKDTDTIVLNSNKTVNVTLDRTNGSCNPPPGDTCQDPNATNFGGPLPCVYPPNPPTNNPPAGVLDATNCGLIGGWAVDNDTPNQAVTIEVYMDGPVGSGTLIATVQANLNRSDVGNHAFHIQPIPAQLRDGRAHTVYIYMLDTATGAKSLLINGVKDIPACGSAPTPTNRPPVGVFDAATCDIIGGWAFDPDNSSQSIVVEIYANGPQGIGTRIFSGATTGLRPDVNTQYGITGNHGFTIFTPQSLKDGNTHEIWVYAQDNVTGVNTLFDNRKIFNSAPCVPTPAPTPTPTPPAGVLDVANCDIIAGWATDSDTPNQAVAIEIYMDGPADTGTLVTKVQADGFRSDVGNHSFHIAPIPALLKDTQGHRIYIYMLDTATGAKSLLINGVKDIPACVVPAQGTINLIKLVRNVTQGQSVFTNSVSANPTDTVEFRIQVNAGNGAVNNVSVSDSLPTRLNYINNSLTVDGSSAGNNLSAIGLGNISGGQTRTILFRATVADSSQFSVGNTLLTNTANATSSANSTSASASVTVGVVQSNTALSINKLARNVTAGQSGFVKNTNASPGDTIQFQIQVSVSGNAAAQNVTVVDTLPQNFGLGTGFTSTNLGTMNPGTSQVVTLTAIASGDASFICGTSNWTNVASASASNANNVSDTATIAVTRTNNCGGGAGNVSMTKSVRNVTQGQSVFTNSVSANPTDTVEFRIQVNAGNGAVNNVSVSDSLPTRLNYINNSLTVDGSNVGNNLSGIGLGNVSAGQTKTILFRATVADSSQFSVGNTLLTNTANATSSANSTSASASVTVGVVQSNTALSINKLARNVTAGQSGFVKNTNASPGDTIQFQIQVSVSGNAAAQNVTVVDTLPQNFGLGTGFTSTNLGTMNPGTSQVVTLTAIASGDASFICGTSNWTNVASASASNANNVSDTATIAVTRTNNCGGGAGNVSMTKSVRNVTQGQSVFTNSVSANPTDTVEFRIQVNAGNGAVNNVSVSDSLPTRLNYINNSLTVDGSNVGNNLSGIGLGNVSAGQTKTILFRATVADSSQFSVGNTLLTNTANATSSANSTSASASVTVGVVQSNTALSINKLARNVTAGQSGFVKNTNASPGDTIQFQIQVSVSGNAAAQNVTVVDTLPQNFGLGTGATTFNLGTINAGATQTLTLSATLAGENSFSCGSITLTNTAQAQATNASLASDTATVTVTRTNNCSSAGNISMAKLVRNITQGQSVFTNNVSANPSDLVEFQIQMTVQGGTVNNVSVSDFLPARLNYSNNSLTLDGSSAGNNLSAIGLGNISVGQTRTILFRATVADSSQFSVGNTLLTNTANATSSANSATASANITVNGTQANASLTMVKLARNVTQGQNVFVKSISANPSDQIQFQIQVTANGSQAQNVNVTDNLPGNMFLNTGSTNFNLGTMNAGSSQIVTLTATISGSGNFNCNSATLTSTAFANSRNSNSNSDTASIFVNATGSCIQNNQVTLSLTKEVRNLTTNNGFFTSSVSANNGDQVQFRLTVRNNNLTTSANNVRLTDSLPAGLTYVPGSFQVDGGSASGSLLGTTEFLGSISPSQSRTIMFNATVNATESVRRTL